MRFTVTPLGAPAGAEAGVARRIADYLMGRAHPDRPLMGAFGPGGPAAGVVGYNRADQLEGDGWWGGQGARRLGLAGTVSTTVLESLLIGRHPVTGERLLSARGSSGRRWLRRGRHTRVVAGVPVWGLDDAAALFDVDRAELEAVLGQVDQGGFVTDEAGRRWLTTEDLDQLSEVITAGPPEGHRQVLDALEALPPDGWLSMAEVIALTGLSDSYYRRVIREWAENRDAIARAEAGEALRWRRAWLRASKVDGRWRIGVEDLLGFWRRRRPQPVRVAYDVVATVEKSVAVLALLSPEPVRSGCVEALLAANAAGMEWLDEQANQGRRQGAPVTSEGFTWASFMHATSRSLDPHPHVHNLVMNFLEDRHGERRAVDARRLYTEAKAASAIATSVLRWELAQRWPGLRWAKHPRSGVSELAGVSAGVIEEFSTRRTEIETAARHFVGPDGRLPTRTELQEISANTRPTKQIVEAASILADWHERADQLGFDPATITGAPAGTDGGGPRFAPVLSETERRELFEFLAESPEGACAQESSFGFGDMLAAINRWSPGGQPRPLPADALLQTANEFLASELAVPVQAPPGGLIRRKDRRPAGTALRERRWTTPQMIRTQVEVLELWDHGIAAGFLTGIAETEITAAGRAAGLGPDQVDLIVRWSSSGDQYQAAIGRPGSGKTHTMRTARRVWEAHGWRVLGAAVKGTAAQHLTRETGIPAETVAYYLTAARNGHQPLDARTVLVIDEATTLSDRDLNALMAMCAASGAVLRMIGDPAQQQSVAAGGMWEHLAGRYASRTPQLAQQRRLQDPVEAETAELLRHGFVAEAFDLLLANGKLKPGATPDQGEQLALLGWFDRHQRGVRSPMIERRNTSRRRLNLIAQTVRVMAGEVTGTHRYAGRDFGVGDFVIATGPDRALFPPGQPGSYLSNGSTGTVTATAPQAVTVDFDGLGEITVPADRAHLLDLGYAITTYSVQGLTVDEAETTARPGEPLDSLYVALTRGRNRNTLIATRPDPTDTHQPTDNDGPGPDPVIDVADNIIDTTLIPAIVADPDLAHLLDLARAPQDSSTLQRLDQRAEHTDLARTIRYALSHPPPDFSDNYPPRPATPWLARTWDTSLAAATTYRHRWHHQPPPPGHHDRRPSPRPRPRPHRASPREGAARGHPALGPAPPPGTDQHNDWQAANHTLEQNARTIIVRWLTDAGADIPADAHHNTARLAAWAASTNTPAAAKARTWLAHYLPDPTDDTTPTARRRPPRRELP